ncbi:hypothetical protein MBAV_003541 [Candidatus Magnetobacterium bavaricum]|uniref:Uncharacterized protein n=1 Tax=Candidatus Magnetobacterium bavaricum TaxID=29290 RepID=A0A0F3GR81_9BACT|nr:hypothetical protein MBAV_003541 [Candidatus Magnetobacterium bavaricum]
MINEVVLTGKDIDRAKERFFQFVDEVHVRNKDVDPGIIEQEIEEAVQSIRISKQRIYKAVKA